MKISQRNRLIVIVWSALVILGLGGTYFFSLKLFFLTFLALVFCTIYSRLTLCKTCQNSCPFNRNSDYFLIPSLRRKQTINDMIYPGKTGLAIVTVFTAFASIAPLYALLKINVFLIIPYIVLYYYAWYLYKMDICKTCKNHCPINPNEGYFSWKK